MSPATTDAAVEIRRMTEDDIEAVQQFLHSIPLGDQTFLREDPFKPEVIERWARETDDSREQALLAMLDNTVVGVAWVFQGIGWSRHVGDLRLVVERDRRRQGIGRLLARRALVVAVEMDISKLVVEVLAEQEATVAMFTALGFEAEALLKDHVRKPDGEAHDLLMLSHFVDELWSAMATTGIDGVLNDG